MNYTEALQTLGAKPSYSLDEITKCYRIKIKQSHPDQGGNTRWFSDVRLARKVVFEQYKYNKKTKDEETGEWTEEKINLSKELQEKLSDILDQLENDGIEISILGAWVWLSGDTKPSKDKIKALGFKFSRNKTSWYWYHGEYKKRGKKQYSLNEIADMHGKVNVNKKLKITAGGN